MRAMDFGKNTNWLANLFDWLGEVFEKFNPSAFRFLAAILPYASPLPVAWLTSRSSADILHFSPAVAFVFVFALEGMGLWFTSLLVDSIVDAIRSKNAKSYILVLIFGIVVSAYIFILVNLNVTLEQASGKVVPALSQVITLICFLPLLTGVGNGYYKLKLEQATQAQVARNKADQREDEDRAFDKAYRLKRLELKHSGTNGNTSRTTSRISKITSGTNSGNTSGSHGTSGTTSVIGRPSQHEMEVFSYIEGQVQSLGRVPTFSEMVRDLKLPNSTISRLRNKWISTH